MARTCHFFLLSGTWRLTSSPSRLALRPRVIIPHFFVALVGGECHCYELRHAWELEKIPNTGLPKLPPVRKGNSFSIGPDPRTRRLFFSIPLPIDKSHKILFKIIFFRHGDLGGFHRTAKLILVALNLRLGILRD